jgi:transposase-like protein
MVSSSPLIDITGLIDDEKCYALIRQYRWPDGVVCPGCQSRTIKRNGRDDTEPVRQRYACLDCGGRFDDLSGTVLAGRHQKLRIWVLCLYFMGLNLSNRQIAAELDLHESDAQAMTTCLREGLVARAPDVQLNGTVEIDEVYVVAGHKGNPLAVEKKTANHAGGGFAARRAAALWRRRNRPSWA